jgi:hypothetical protein
MKNTQYHFKCLYGTQQMYTPEFMFDVEGMRKHPDYVEVDADGQPVAKPDYEAVQRPLMTVPAHGITMQKASAPKSKRK